MTSDVAVPISVHGPSSMDFRPQTYVLCLAILCPTPYALRSGVRRPAVLRPPILPSCPFNRHLFDFVQPSLDVRLTSVRCMAIMGLS